MLVQTRRQQSTSPGAGNRTPGQDQGKTEKEFEKDGTGSNKNLVYVRPSHTLYFCMVKGKPTELITVILASAPSGWLVSTLSTLDGRNR